MREIICGATPLSPALPKSLQGHFKTDFVPVLEAIGNGLGQRIDPHRYPFNLMLLDTFCLWETREANDTKGRIVNAWFTRFPINRHPHLVGRLRPYVVETERSEETNHPMWDALRGLGKRMILRHVCVRGHVEAPARPHQHAFGNETADVLRVDAVRRQVLEAQHPQLSDELQNFLTF